MLPSRIPSDHVNKTFQSNRDYNFGHVVVKTSTNSV